MPAQARLICACAGMDSRLSKTGLPNLAAESGSVSET
jgi:hypothetical protein